MSGQTPVEEQYEWTPGIVDINKITKNFVYSTCTIPHRAPSKKTAHNEDPDLRIKLGKCQRKWNNRIRRKAELTAILDSGATSHFVKSSKGCKITGKTAIKVVRMPDGHVTNTTEQVVLPLPALTEEAKKADVLPALTHDNLMSVSKLANAGYTTIFHPHNGGVTVHQAGTGKITLDREIILQGWRDERSGLWRVPL